MISEATQTTSPSTKTQRDVAIQVGAPANMLSASVESQVARVLLRLKHERVLHETAQRGQVFEKYQGLNAHVKVHRNAERRAQEAADAAAVRTVVTADTQSQ
ncbi:MAG: hypothetical protein MHM6MM_001926 [Cercozoa sp. M6MM]